MKIRGLITRCSLYIHRKVLHHPSRNIAVLEERLNAIEFFMDPNNLAVVENLSCCLRQVYRLTNTILACCSWSQVATTNWLKLYKVDNPVKPC